MKHFLLSSAILVLGFSANAAYPVTCQLDMLAIAAPALNHDSGMYEFFDLSKVTFDITANKEPMVVFAGKSADVMSSKQCRAEVKMEVPAETLGCPDFKLKSISVVCQ